MISLGNTNSRVRGLRAACLFFGLILPASCLAGDPAFRRHVINADSLFMAAAVMDVDKDGKLDIVCGGYWYEAPTWKNDKVTGVEGVKRAVASATAVYELRRVAKSLQATYPDGGRDFSSDTRAEAYAWLDQRLKR